VNFTRKRVILTRLRVESTYHFLLCGVYTKKFAGSTQNPEKIIEQQIMQSERKFSQKNYVYYLKKEKKQKIRMRVPDGICRLVPKSQKNYRNAK
jgi:hypothetical protein